MTRAVADVRIDAIGLMGAAKRARDLPTAREERDRLEDLVRTAPTDVLAFVLGFAAYAAWRDAADGSGWPELRRSDA